MKNSKDRCRQTGLGTPERLKRLPIKQPVELWGYPLDITWTIWNQLGLDRVQIDNLKKPKKSLKMDQSQLIF